MEALPAGAQKDQAEADLKTLLQEKSSVDQDIASAKTQLGDLETGLQQLTDPTTGAIAELQKLAAESNPTQQDLDQANSLLADVQNVENEQQPLLNTLNTLNQDIQTLKTGIAAVQQDLLNPYQQGIQQDYAEAEKLAAELASEIGQDQTAVNNLEAQLASVESTIAGLEQQVSNMPSGAQKDQAEKDLATLESLAKTLTADISTAKTQLATLQQALQTLNAPGTGILAQLEALAQKTDPSEQDLQAANGLLNTVQGDETAQQNFANGPLKTATADLAAVNSAITMVQNDISPPPPPAKVENGVWYIDWDSWDYPIPQGVNTVNLFVGQIDYVNGQYTMDGFGNFTPEKLEAFIQKCHEQGIAVKVSIGGSGGMYDNCWDKLTPENVAAYAQGMVAFCQQYGLDGVDFDYEEGGENPAQQKLVGELIYDFKKDDPSLKASLCTNAGFGPNFEWQQRIQNILDAANGAVDHLYIMSYFNSIDDEEKWITGWYQWAKERYGFSASQISVGIDPSSGAYNVDDLVKWAAQNGFSTSIWNWDPNDPNSNQEAQRVWNDYYGKDRSLTADYSQLAKDAAIANEIASNLAASIA